MGVGAAVALAGCGGTAASGESSAKDVTAEAEQRFVLQLEDGQPAAGPGQWRATEGEVVEIAVTGGGTDELHLHGYDIARELDGGAASMRFEADQTGVFELELEEAGVPLGSLTVYPDK